MIALWLYCLILAFLYKCFLKIHVYLLNIVSCNVKTFCVSKVLQYFCRAKKYSMTAETRNFIIDKAQNLFYRYGIKSITMDFIASELRISKRTLYENFKNKEELIIECMKRAHLENETMICSIFNSNANVLEKLVRCYSHILQFYKRSSRSFRLDVEQMHNKVNEQVEEYQEKQHKYICKILHMGVKQGLIRTDLNIEIATELHNQWFTIIHRNTESMFNFAEYVSTMVRIYLYGIVTDAGRKVLDENYELITQTL